MNGHGRSSLNRSRTSRPQEPTFSPLRKAPTLGAVSSSLKAQQEIHLVCRLPSFNSQLERPDAPRPAGCSVWLLGGTPELLRHGSGNKGREGKSHHISCSARVAAVSLEMHSCRHLIVPITALTPQRTCLAQDIKGWGMHWNIIRSQKG